MLFNYPPLALLGRIIAREKIFRQAKADTKTQAEFSRAIKQLRWQYKLAPQILNIAASEQVKEVQIFSLALNRRQINNSLLELIDKAIPSSIIFELNFAGQVKMAACLKKQGQISSPYFATDWQAADSPRKPLPFALNMAQLYEKMLESIIGANLPPGPEQAEAGRAVLSPLQESQKVQRGEALQPLEAKIARAEQFRCQLNAELSAAMRQLKILEKR